MGRTEIENRQSAIASDPLAAARKRLAELTGLMMRVHGHLGLEGAGHDEREAKLAEWCAKEERTKTDQLQTSNAWK